MSMLNEEQRQRVEKNMAKPLPEEAKMRSFGRNLICSVAWFLMRILYRIRVVNPEKMPEEGATLFCSNHTHYFDIPLACVQLKRWIYWIARESLFKSRFSAKFLPWWGAIPLDVNNSEPKTIKKIFQYLKEGKCLGIFPQGTRCSTPEKLRNTVPKTGAISFAIKTGATILPVAVDGEFKPFHKVTIILGDPYKIDLPPRTRLSDEELMFYTIDLMDRIFALRGKEYPLKDKSKLTGGRIPDALDPNPDWF